MPVVGSRIRERRLALGLSQQQLGGKELTRSFVSLVEQGKAQPSRPTLELLAKRLGKPPEYFVSEDRNADEEAITLLQRATQRLVAEQNWPEAVQHAESALRMAERVGRPELELALRMSLAYCCLFAQQYEAALVVYDQAIDDSKTLNDRNTLAEAYFRKGMTCQMLEDYFNARRNYLESIRLMEEKKSLAETKASALINLGSCYSIMGEVSEAIQAYESAIRTILPSEYPELYIGACTGLSVSMQRLSRWQEALHYAHETLRIVPSSDTAAVVDARVRVASIQAEIGEIEIAFPVLRECLEVYRAAGKLRRQARVLNQLALCYLKRNELAQVEALCEEALNLLDLQDDGLLRGVVYRRLAQAYLAKGDKERAKEFVRVSINILKRIKAHGQVEETAQLLIDWV